MKTTLNAIYCAVAAVVLTNQSFATELTLEQAQKLAEERLSEELSESEQIGAELERALQKYDINLNLPKKWEFRSEESNRNHLAFVKNTPERAKENLDIKVSKFHPRLDIFIKNESPAEIFTNEVWFEKTLVSKYKDQVADFKVFETFTKRLADDRLALIAYSTSKFSKHDLYHMHVFIASADKSYFFNMTNIGRWSKSDPKLVEDVWGMVTTASTSGKQQWVPMELVYSGFGVFFFFNLVWLVFLLNRANKRIILENIPQQEALQWANVEETRV